MGRHGGAGRTLFPVFEHELRPPANLIYFFEKYEGKRKAWKNHRDPRARVPRITLVDNCTVGTGEACPPIGRSTIMQAWPGQWG